MNYSYFMRSKDITTYVKVQRNFHIRKQDRELWAQAQQKAEEEDKLLYEILTQFLKKWVKE